MLTDREHEAMELTGKLANILLEICREPTVIDDRSQFADYNELVIPLHKLQYAILSQSAAREYPDRYRLLGGTFLK